MPPVAAFIEPVTPSAPAKSRPSFDSSDPCDPDDVTAQAYRVLDCLFLSGRDVLLAVALACMQVRLSLLRYRPNYSIFLITAVFITAVFITLRRSLLRLLYYGITKIPIAQSQ